MKRTVSSSIATNYYYVLCQLICTLKLFVFLFITGKLSFDPMTCTNDQNSPYDPFEFWLRPYMTLDEEFIMAVREKTGRYVVAIRGMSLNDDLPCEDKRTKTSRWALQSSSASCTAIVGSQTFDTFAETITVNQGYPNPNVREVTRYKRGCNEEDRQKTDLGYLPITTGELGLQCWRHVHPKHLNVYDMSNDSYNGRPVRDIVGNSAIWNFNGGNFDQAFRRKTEIGKFGDVGKVTFCDCKCVFSNTMLSHFTLFYYFSKCE